VTPIPAPDLDHTTSIDTFCVKLTPDEFADHNLRFPASEGSNQIGGRALEIVKTHFRRTHPGCQFVAAARGADLGVLLDGSDPMQFEVKGTAAGNIAWQQLKVSSQAGHDLLVACKASVLRVTKVYGDEPVVFELRCGRDFRLEPEARWCVKPMRGALADLCFSVNFPASTS
jgi:hypothetical protein